MVCVINQTIADRVDKGNSLTEVKKYIENRYKVEIEEAALRRRLKNLKLQFP